MNFKKSFYNFYNITIVPSYFIKDSLVIQSNNESLLTSDYYHIFYILKKYLNTNTGYINSLYFVLIDDKFKNKPTYLYKIYMNDIINMKNDHQFLEWWEKVILKLTNYETSEKTVKIILHLNIDNIIKNYNIKKDDWVYYQPNKFNNVNFKKILNFLFYLLFFVSLILNIYFFAQ